MLFCRYTRPAQSLGGALFAHWPNVYIFGKRHHLPSCAEVYLTFAFIAVMLAAGGILGFATASERDHKITLHQLQ